MNTSSVRIETVKTGPWKQNCFIVHDGKKAVVVDPGDDAEKIIALIGNLSLSPLAIVNTHAHFDHVAAVKALQNHFKIPFYLHQNELPLLKRANLYRLAILRGSSLQVPEVDVLWNNDSSQISFDDFNFTIHQTPGHTQGGVCLEIAGHIFVGDTVLESNLIPNNLPEENPALLRKSLEYLSSLNPQLIAMPGHGHPAPLGEKLKLVL